MTRLPLTTLTLAALLATNSLAAQATLRATLTCDANGCVRGIDSSGDDGAGRPPDPSAVDRAENGTFGLSASTGQLRAWTPYSLLGTGTSIWDPTDSGGDPNSGSLRITNTGGNPDPDPQADSRYGMGQCVRPGDIIYTPSPNPTCYYINGRVRIPAGQVPGVGLWEGVVWLGALMYQSNDCSGPTTGLTAGGVLFTPQGTNGWESRSIGVCAVPGYRSIRHVVAVQKENSIPGPITAYLDDITFLARYKFVKGDIDGDGETDLLLRNNNTAAAAAWYMKDEARRGAPVAITPSPASLDWQPTGIDDFNADGRNDLLMWNSATGSSEFWLMNGPAREGSPVPLAGPLTPWKPAATADVNVDGSPDIIWRNYSTQKISIWTMNGTTALGTLTPKPDQAVDGNWEIVGAPDLNGDGTTDFLWYNATSGKIVYWFMNYAGDTITCSGQGLTPPCYYRLLGNFTAPANAGNNNWKVLAAGDYGIGPSFDGPAIPNTTDLVWRNATSGRMVVWFMDTAGNRTAGVFMSPDPPAPATDWTIAGPR